MIDVIETIFTFESKLIEKKTFKITRTKGGSLKFEETNDERTWFIQN